MSLIAALDAAKMVELTKISARISTAIRCTSVFFHLTNNQWAGRILAPIQGWKKSWNMQKQACRDVRLCYNCVANMTKDTIERAIARGEPKMLGSGFSYTTYEVMLPNTISVVM